MIKTFVLKIDWRKSIASLHRLTQYMQCANLRRTLGTLLKFYEFYKLAEKTKKVVYKKSTKLTVCDVHISLFCYCAAIGGTAIAPVCGWGTTVLQFSHFCSISRITRSLSSLSMLCLNRIFQSFQSLYEFLLRI